MANRWGNSGNSGWVYFLGLQNHCRWWLQPWIKRRLLLGRKVMTNLDSILKRRDITLQTKVRLVKAMVFPVRLGIWRKLSTEELMLLNCGVGEDSWESLGLQGDPTSPSYLKEINSEYSLEGLMLKLKLQYFWLPEAKSLLIGKDPRAGKDWRREEKQLREDGTVGWHHRLNGREFE